MRQLSVFLLVLGLISCSNPLKTYGTKQEAESACSQWESEEKKLFEVKYIEWGEEEDWVNKPAVNVDSVITSRYCLEEDNTSQIIGFENGEIQNETFEDADGKRGEWKIVEHFHYK